MTSQLVLVNQLAVAVASDTLVSSRTSTDVKTTPSLSKIYQLPSPANVVVLSCGWAYLQSTLWRVLVRDWALDSAPLTAPRVVDYRDEFFNWVNRHATRLSLSNEAGVSTRLGGDEQRGGHIGWLVNEMGSLNREELLRDPAGMDSDLSQVIDAITAKYYSEISFPDISAKDALRLIQESDVDVIWNFRRAYGLDDDAIVGPATQESVLKFACAALRTSPAWERNGMILSFAGFGSQESLGQVAQLFVYGFWGGKLRCEVAEHGSEHHSEYSMFVPIAQTSAIDAFANGLSGDMAGFIGDAAERAVKSIESISEEIAAKTLEEFGTAINSYRNQNFLQPMLGTMDGLGISNLGKFADFLLHLQAFRSATDLGEATVGGQIESLVISPEFGVRWRNRLSSEVHGIEESSHVFE